MMNLIDLIHHLGEQIETTPCVPFVKGDYILIPFVKGDYILISLF